MGEFGNFDPGFVVNGSCDLGLILPLWKTLLFICKMKSILLIALWVGKDRTGFLWA